MEAWTGLLNILILLAAALALGTLAEGLKQSSIVGYLIAGMLVGPNLLGWVGTREEVDFVAELGVTLLLFSIGLEFSFKRLVRLGPVTYLGGTAQVVLTTLVVYSLCSSFGLGWRPALVIGMMVALSSTAIVMRMLVNEAQLDSIYGRNSLGILLLQDVAVVPLILVTMAISGESSPSQMVFLLVRTVVLGLGMIAVFYLLLHHLVPRLLNLQSWSQNRELPILLAIVLALGSAWAAHKAGLTPSFGAFLAGLLLAESPFATQIRADVASLRTLLVTLFFAAIGMLVNPFWIMANPIPVFSGLMLLVILKLVIIYLIVRALGFSRGPALATGVCLAQIGEFSFVIAKIAYPGGIIDDYLFGLIVSVTMLSLLLTPYLVRGAPALACRAESLRALFGTRRKMSQQQTGEQTAIMAIQNPILIIGFGPAGQRVAEMLLPHYSKQLLVLDINPSNAEWAQGLGIMFHIGNAQQSEVLEHVQVRQALA
ncbi:MAG: cation:proton antiporter, partial [Gemmatimonadota bacterium]|nr:cation:proton antiporter [Gemmatimonadota bacterium]